MAVNLQKVSLLASGHHPEVWSEGGRSPWALSCWSVNNQETATNYNEQVCGHCTHLYLHHATLTSFKAFIFPLNDDICNNLEADEWRSKLQITNTRTLQNVNCTSDNKACACTYIVRKFLTFISGGLKLANIGWMSKQTQNMPTVNINMNSSEFG